MRQKVISDICASLAHQHQQHEAMTMTLPPHLERRANQLAEQMQMSPERVIGGALATLSAIHKGHLVTHWKGQQSTPPPLDAVYTERAHLVAALSKFFPASIEQHIPKDGESWDSEWLNVVFIDLPTGQVSWHIALSDMHLFQHIPRGAGRTWDGHTTPEKYARLDALAP